MAIDRKLIDELLANYKKPEDIIGENGLSLTRPAVVKSFLHLS